MEGNRKKMHFHTKDFSYVLIVSGSSSVSKEEYSIDGCIVLK